MIKIHGINNQNASTVPEYAVEATKLHIINDN